MLWKRRKWVAHIVQVATETRPASRKNVQFDNDLLFPFSVSRHHDAGFLKLRGSQHSFPQEKWNQLIFQKGVKTIRAKKESATTHKIPHLRLNNAACLLARKEAAWGQNSGPIVTSECSLCRLTSFSWQRLFVNKKKFLTGLRFPSINLDWSS